MCQFRSTLLPGSLQNQSNPHLMEGREGSGRRSRNHIPCPLSAHKAAHSRTLQSSLQAGAEAVLRLLPPHPPPLPPQPSDQHPGLVPAHNRNQQTAGCPLSKGDLQSFSVFKFSVCSSQINHYCLMRGMLLRHASVCFIYGNIAALWQSWLASLVCNKKVYL